MKEKILVSLVLCIAIISCSKDKDPQPYKNQDIKGQVFNLCTDSGIAILDVDLIYPCHSDACSRMGRSIEMTFVPCDINGNFNFTRWPIYKGETYTLTAYGAKIFNDTQASQFFKFNATPKYDWLKVAPNHTPLTAHSDSISFVMNQKIYHKNMPDSSYRNTLKFYGDQTTQPVTFSNQPMGLWNISIDKWISGVHTTIKDSIYLNEISTKTYNINW